jgi:hypothetical protein
MKSKDTEVSLNEPGHKGHKGHKGVHKETGLYFFLFHLAYFPGHLLDTSIHK